MEQQSTPQAFITKFPKYVYRSHKGKETVQWRQAALEMYEENQRLRAAGERCLAALRANGAPNCEAAKEMTAAMERA